MKTNGKVACETRLLVYSWVNVNNKANDSAWLEQTLQNTNLNNSDSGKNGVKDGSHWNKSMGLGDRQTSRRKGVILSQPQATTRDG